MKLSEYLKILQGFMDTYGDMEVYEERGGCSGLHPGAIWLDRPLEAGQTYSVRIT